MYYDSKRIHNNKSETSIALPYIPAKNKMYRIKFKLKMDALTTSSKIGRGGAT